MPWSLMHSSPRLAVDASIASAKLVSQPAGTWPLGVLKPHDQTRRARRRCLRRSPDTARFVTACRRGSSGPGRRGRFGLLGCSSGACHVFMSSSTAGGDAADRVANDRGALDLAQVGLDMAMVMPSAHIATVCRRSPQSARLRLGATLPVLPRRGAAVPRPAVAIERRSVTWSGPWCAL